MKKMSLDRLILKFLRDNPKDEFQAKDLRQTVARGLQLRQIRQALGRLRKKKLVSKHVYKSGERHWGAR